VCNKTNAEKIALITGSHVFDEWKGHKITIGWKWTEFSGKTVKGIRVMMPGESSPRQGSAAPAPETNLPLDTPAPAEEPPPPEWGEGGPPADDIPF
jgi:hypothetical protein